MYHQSETLLVPSRLYYLRPHYKSHFAGHSSLSIVPVHFNFRPRCKFHLRVLPGSTTTTTSAHCNDELVRVEGSFRFDSLRGKVLTPRRPAGVQPDQEQFALPIRLPSTRSRDVPSSFHPCQVSSLIPDMRQRDNSEFAPDTVFDFHPETSCVIRAPR